LVGIETSATNVPVQPASDSKCNTKPARRERKRKAIKLQQQHQFSNSRINMTAACERKTTK